MILTDQVRKSKGIGVGDEIFVAGLFVYHHGNAKNIPIIRIGNIAMIPDERIQTSSFGDMEAYLVELRSTEGLSGSPVFVTAEIDKPETYTHLLGLIHGHWDIPPDTIIDTTIQDTGIRAGVNVGIAIVTPASKILDTINCDELVLIRQKKESDWLSKNPPPS